MLRTQVQRPNLAAQPLSALKHNLLESSSQKIPVCLGVIIGSPKNSGELAQWATRWAPRKNCTVLLL